MEVIKVGIIDDDGSKVTQIMAYLLYGMKDASKQKADRYSNVRDCEKKSVNKILL